MQDRLSRLALFGVCGSRLSIDRPPTFWSTFLSAHICVAVIVRHCRGSPQRQHKYYGRLHREDPISVWKRRRADAERDTHYMNTFLAETRTSSQNSISSFPGCRLLPKKPWPCTPCLYSKGHLPSAPAVGYVHLWRSPSHLTTNSPTVLVTPAIVCKEQGHKG